MVDFQGTDDYRPGAHWASVTQELWASVLALAPETTIYFNSRGEIEVFPPTGFFRALPADSDLDLAGVLVDDDSSNPVEIIQLLVMRLSHASAGNIDTVRYQLQFLSDQHRYIPQVILYGQVAEPCMTAWRRHIKFGEFGFNFAEGSRNNGESLRYCLYQDGRIALYL